MAKRSKHVGGPAVGPGRIAQLATPMPMPSVAPITPKAPPRMATVTHPNRHLNLGRYLHPKKGK